MILPTPAAITSSCLPCHQADEDTLYQIPPCCAQATSIHGSRCRHVVRGSNPVASYEQRIDQTRPTGSNSRDTVAPTCFLCEPPLRRPHDVPRLREHQVAERRASKRGAQGVILVEDQGEGAAVFENG